MHKFISFCECVNLYITLDASAKNLHSFHCSILDFLVQVSRDTVKPITAYLNLINNNISEV